MAFDRRAFLRAAAAAGTGAALDKLIGGLAQAQQLPASPYGPLRPVAPIDGDGTPVVALPPGFQARQLSYRAKRMSDGLTTPEYHDGMSSFEVGGFIRLVRNHEVRTRGTPIGPRELSYDPVATGGTTTVIVDPVTRTVVRDFVSLSGTTANCSGGPTPWGSWISCEEAVGGPHNGFLRPHGYCFEIPASADGPVEPRPIVAMGRFKHEAVVIDPRTSVAFMTEDEETAGFYRYIPNEPGNLAAGGRLQMLTVLGRPHFHGDEGVATGVTMRVGWIDIPDPDPVIRDETDHPIFDYGYGRGGMRFRRLEGAVFGGGSIYFASTTGGEEWLGQIWRYTPHLALPRRRPIGGGGSVLRPESEGTLTLLYEPNDRGTMKAPDNLAFSPKGCLLFCEDTYEGAQYIRAIAPGGVVFDFCRNAYPGLENTELAGATFSPDGSTLFVNVFAPAITLAIWGPWELGPL